MDLKISPENTCCFTGYRPEKLPWRYDEEDPRCRLLKIKLYDVVDALYFSGIRHYICGMAKGCDMFFAEAVLKLKREHDDVTLEAAIPCRTQTMRWDKSDVGRYKKLMKQCDYTTFLQNEYTRDCMFKRNRYMVDNSAVVVAVYDGKSGGTAFTVRYADRNNKEIIEIHP